MHSAVLVIVNLSVRLSVCLSVYLSVTLVDCVDMVRPMKIDPYYQQQKCSPCKISYMWIFAGVRWRGGVKWELVGDFFLSLFFSLHYYSVAFCQLCFYNKDWLIGLVENGDFRFFRSLFLPNCNIQWHNYYTVIYSRSGVFSDIEIDDLEWPWMDILR